MTSKTIEIVAGPNGSGKTSFAQTYFASKNNKANFINADVIAGGLAPGREEEAAFQAGRIVLSTVKEAIEKDERLAFESTLSGKTWIPVIKRAKERQYSIIIYFLFLKDVKLNLARIEKRVRLGGHLVPDAVVKRRYRRSFENFWTLYRPYCDDWYVFDNSAPKPKSLMSRQKWESTAASLQVKFDSSFLKKGRLRNGKK